MTALPPSVYVLSDALWVSGEALFAAAQNPTVYESIPGLELFETGAAALIPNLDGEMVARFAGPEADLSGELKAYGGSLRNLAAGRATYEPVQKAVVNMANIFSRLPQTDYDAAVMRTRITGYTLFRERVAEKKAGERPSANPAAESRVSRASAQEPLMTSAERTLAELSLRGILQREAEKGLAAGESATTWHVMVTREIKKAIEDPAHAKEWALEAKQIIEDLQKYAARHGESDKQVMQTLLRLTSIVARSVFRIETEEGLRADEGSSFVGTVSDLGVDALKLVTGVSLFEWLVSTDEDDEDRRRGR